MTQFSLPNFIDANLTRHIATVDEPNVSQRVNRVFKMNHDHFDTDQDRLIRGAVLIIKGISAIPLGTWAKKAAKYSAATDILDMPGLPEEARLALSKEIGTTQPNKNMRGVRLTTAMLAIVREDAKSTLVASIKAEKAEALDFHTCGEKAYASYLLDLLTSPPQGIFCLIEFDKTPATVAKIHPTFYSGKKSTPTIRTHASEYRPHIFCDALAATRSADPNAPAKLINLIKTRRDNPEASTKIDKQIEAMIDSFPSAPDFYDLADLLTELTPAELSLLRFSLYRDKNETQPNQDTIAEDEI